MASSSLRFQGTAWLLSEPKGTFYSPRYSHASLSVRLQLLPFWTEPQPILQVGQTDFLVLNCSPQDAAKRSGDPKETKKLLQMTVRPLDDVRRVQLYQTAARVQLLELFVDVEHTRQRLLRCLSGQEEQEAGTKLLDEAFEALERAQQSEDRETALQLYKGAERGFYEAQQVLPDDKSRELLKVRRGDLQRTIRELETREEERAGVVQQTLSVPPVVETEVRTTPPAMDISARLEELQRFAAEQESGQENSTPLATRFAALKNEKAGPAPPVDDLVERLRRLRGDNAKSGEKVADEKSAVGRIIEQVTDEIALGIGYDEIDVDEELDSDSLSSSKSASSESSKSSQESGV